MALVTTDRMTADHREEPHAITQARLRYGLELTEGDLAAIARLCAKGELLKREPPRDSGGEREWRRVTFRDVVMIVVWIPCVQAIATVLPPDAAGPAKKFRKRSGKPWRWR